MRTNKSNRGAKAAPAQDDLAQLLLQCRVERNLSLEEVARAVELSKGGLSNIERGKSAPRRTTRGRIEDFLRKHGYFPKAVA